MSFLKLFTVLTFSASFALAATAGVKTHKNEKFKYSLSAPEKWVVQELKDATSPVKLNLWGDDKKVSMILMVSENDAKTATVDFLKSMEAARNLKNKLKADQSIVAPALLKKWNVSEGSRAEYELTGKGPNFPVIQKTLVLKKAKLVYAIIFAYPKADESKFKKSLEDVEISFRALD